MSLLKRRIVLRSGLISASYLTISNFVIAADSSPKESYAAPKAADQWMKKWMGEAKLPDGRKAPINTLYLGRFADPMYFLRQSMGWKPNADQASKFAQVIVPVGFVTDFASIPRIFWSALRPDGIYGYAAIVHDYLYWEQHVERDVADQLLKFSMQDFKINNAIIETIYRAVRVGGGSAWAENQRLKASGERRVLAQFPEDPTIRWEEWKKKPGVFS